MEHVHTEAGHQVKEDAQVEAAEKASESQNPEHPQRGRRLWERRGAAAGGGITTRISSTGWLAGWLAWLNA